MSSQSKLDAIKNDNERKFAEKFFDHDDWISQPAAIDLGGYTYRPDFYDKRRNVYIEVIASRQAFHQNKAKYFKMVEVLGKEKLEIRDPSGKKLDLSGKVPHMFTVWDVVGMYEQYEKAFLKILNTEIERGKISLQEIADKAFPHHHDAINKTSLILEGKLHISFTDFYVYAML